MGHLQGLPCSSAAHGRPGFKDGAGHVPPGNMTEVDAWAGPRVPGRVRARGPPLPLPGAFGVKTPPGSVPHLGDRTGAVFMRKRLRPGGQPSSSIL